MEHKFTPGPWSVDSYDGKSTIEINGNDGIAICKVDNISIEDEHKQRLIAALEKCLEQL